MNYLQIFKKKLSISLKFVAISSIIFQLILVAILFSRTKSDIVFLIVIFTFPFIIFIGLSRYVEIKSKNIKEKFLNLLYFLNCFPILIILLPLTMVLIISIVQENSDNEKIELKPNEIKFHFKEKNGKIIEKSGEEVRLDINSLKKDSVIKFRYKD